MFDAVACSTSALPPTKGVEWYAEYEYELDGGTAFGFCTGIYVGRPQATCSSGTWSVTAACMQGEHAPQESSGHVTAVSLTTGPHGLTVCRGALVYIMHELCWVKAGM